MGFRRSVLAMLRMFSRTKIANTPYWLFKGTYYTANHGTNHFYGVYSHWPSPGPGQGMGPGPERMGCMVLRRTFHTAPEQWQGHEQGQRRMGYVPIFQVLKRFQVVSFNGISMEFQVSSPGPRHSQCVPVPVSLPVLETANVDTPLEIVLPPKFTSKVTLSH